RMNTFLGGAIYFSVGTGAHVVYGDIGALYNSSGGPASNLGLPTSDEQGIPDNGRVQSFQYGAICWSPSTGALLLQHNQTQMYVPTDQPQDDDWSCGPNSVSRVLRYYGIDASYQDVRNFQQEDTDLVSRVHLGSRPGSL